MSFRHARQAHALGDAFALGEIDGVVALDVGEIALDREIRVDREGGADLPARLVKPAQMRERGAQVKKGRREVAVGLNRSSTSRDRLIVGTKIKPRHPREVHPQVSECVTRTEA